MKLRKRDAHYHTYADYLTWSATHGDELINGAAYVREPPGPSLSHQGVVLELGRQIANALEGKPCRVFVAPFDLRLPSHLRSAGGRAFTSCLHRTLEVDADALLCNPRFFGHAM